MYPFRHTQIWWNIINKYTILSHKKLQNILAGIEMSVSDETHVKCNQNGRQQVLWRKHQVGRL